MDSEKYQAIYLDAQQALANLQNGATPFGVKRLTDFSEHDETVLQRTIEAYGALLSAHLFNDTHNLLETFTGVTEAQVLHNGYFVYGHPRGDFPNLRWCHLILLRSKHPIFRQHVAIISQLPGAVSIVNFIENVATCIVNSMWEASDGVVDVTPSNTTFVEHLGIGCFSEIQHTTDDWAIMQFQWEHKGEEWKAGGVQRNHAEKSNIQKLVAAL